MKSRSMSHHIVAINGSSRPEAYNAKLLKAIGKRYANNSVELIQDLSSLPLYLADQENSIINTAVHELRASISTADAVIISTPEYIHNIPAILKNTLEWVTASGEMNDKRVLPITFSPHEPRGTQAMTSLIASLQALNAKIVGSLQLYQNELIIDDESSLSGTLSIELLDAAMTSLIV